MTQLPTPKLPTATIEMDTASVQKLIELIGDHVPHNKCRKYIDHLVNAVSEANEKAAQAFIEGERVKAVKAHEADAARRIAEAKPVPVPLKDRRQLAAERLIGGSDMSKGPVIEEALTPRGKVL